MYQARVVVTRRTPKLQYREARISNTAASGTCFVPHIGYICFCTVFAVPIASLGVVHVAFDVTDACSVHFCLEVRVAYIVKGNVRTVDRTRFEQHCGITETPPGMPSRHARRHGGV